MLYVKLSAAFLRNLTLRRFYTNVPKSDIFIHLTKTTAAQNEVALSYHSVRRLYFLAVVFVTNIVCWAIMVV